MANEIPRGNSDPQAPPLRLEIEARERLQLCPRAQASSQSRGRLNEEEECTLRTAYQRDRDRIVHCKAFRRLKHKTQVFLSPTGDHYRTRLTHTLEVSQIARTIGRGLRLNEDLIEAIALGHDLGHTPFGHGGERVLDQIIPGGFHHTGQSLRVVDRLENGGRGLNLTHEVREGIVKHSKGRCSPIFLQADERAETLEAQVVRLADIVAYLNHDLDDALRADILKDKDIPDAIRIGLGTRHSRRIHTLVHDIIHTNLGEDRGEIGMSASVLAVVDSLRVFLFDHVYDVPQVRREFDRVHKIIEDLYTIFMKDDRLFSQEIGPPAEGTSRERQICDYIAGMTDRYALDLYKRLFLPRPWMKL
ncbi:MAG: deoxyguanosinetriphosphate triphosphohydrolase [Syntrophobacteraceae bacterium]